MSTEERYYLSKQDLEDRHEDIEKQFGNDKSNCGGWTFDPPCGGCIGCLHMMTSHFFKKEREEANRYQAAGLEVANPNVIDTRKIMKAGGWSWGEFHDWWGHITGGEIIHGEYAPGVRYPKPPSTE